MRGAVRVLRISHSATVAAWRGREDALRERGAEVTLLTAKRWHAGGAEVQLDHIEDDTFGVRTWGRHPALFLYDPRPLWRALGRRWDVIDIHEEPFALATAETLLLRTLRRQRAPYVLYTAQNLRKRYPLPFRWFERHALTRAAGISACNTEAAAIAEEKGFPGRARVIPLGVDPAEFAVAEADSDAAPRRGTSEDPIVVGLLGRLTREKGVGVLLEALALEPRLRARIAGSGPLAAELPAAAKALGVAERVELVGPIAPAEVPDFLRSVDVLSVPSLPTPSWTEQFGRVAVEAMACGIPVVVSDAGALPEVVGDAGIIVPAGDAAALADGVVAAAGYRRAELLASGFARAGRYSWQAVAGDYLELYGSIVRGSTRPEPPIEVIVVAYGAPGLLRAALEPVAQLPVTVIDNSSLPEIAALCAELGVRYLDAGSNVGFGAGVNLGLAHLRSPSADVLLLNPDARIEPDHVSRLQRALHDRSDLASVAPAQVDDRGRSARIAWPFPSPRNAWLEAVGLGRWQTGASYVIGAVLLLRAEALQQVGAFDERFFLYAEEADWAYRAHLLGWRHAQVPDAHASHVGGGTSSDARRREAHFHASQERFFRKHYGRTGWASTRIAVWVGSLVRSFLLTGDRRSAARRRAALYRLGPVRVESRLTRAGGE
jgi:glycosyltransferase involved in cell wall biosynthesis/GT2 family glycosyltransferase